MILNFVKNIKELFIQQYSYKEAGTHPTNDDIIDIG